MNQFKKLNITLLISILIVLVVASIIAVLINDIVFFYIGIGVSLYSFGIILLAELFVCKIGKL